MLGQKSCIEKWSVISSYLLYKETHKILWSSSQRSHVIWDDNLSPSRAIIMDTVITIMVSIHHHRHQNMCWQHYWHYWCCNGHVGCGRHQHFWKGLEDEEQPPLRNHHHPCSGRWDGITFALPRIHILCSRGIHHACGKLTPEQDGNGVSRPTADAA